MAALGESATDILTQAHDPLQKMLTQILLNLDGDFEITQQTGQTMTAGQAPTGVYLVEPPQDQTDTEWIIQALQMKDTANIDPQDRMGFVYIDTITGYVYHIYHQVGSASSSIKQVTWNWPSNIQPQVVSNSDVCGEYRPYRLFRRRNGESWRRIRVDAQATATVGTRLLQLTAVYLRRPLTRI